MNIFKLEFKSQLHSMLVWGCILSLTLIGLISLFPAMQNDAMKALTDAKLQSLPPAVLAAFGLTEMTDFTILTNYFSVMIQYINMAICVYAATLGATALIKEETDGTIEYLYAQPVTRFDIVREKMLASVCAFAILPLLMGGISCILLAIVNKGKIPYMELLEDVALTFSGLFFAGIVFMSIGFLASTLLKTSKQATPFALGAVFGTFLIGVVSAMIKDLEFLVIFSPLDTVSPNKLMEKGFDIGGVLVGVILILTCSALSFFIYNKKDFKI
ncbi:MAG: ABC transporter permease subunit [Oscillospiraceae bacterium]